MRIVSWNCCGKFREKLSCISELKADIYVIQECENPKKYTKKLAEVGFKYVWTGENDRKGIGIFIKDGLGYKLNEWPSYCLRNFLSVKVGEKLDVVGVWAGKPYIEEYYIYQSINLDKIGVQTIIIGDFNSNAQWDKEHGQRNHSAAVAQLKQRGLVSAYHYLTGELQGEEQQATFYMYRHADKPYHIDHCFVSPSYLADYRIIADDKWLVWSDHFPIQLEICDDIAAYREVNT